MVDTLQDWGPGVQVDLPGGGPAEVAAHDGRAGDREVVGLFDQILRWTDGQFPVKQTRGKKWRIPNVSRRGSIKTVNFIL